MWVTYETKKKFNLHFVDATFVFWLVSVDYLKLFNFLFIFKHPPDKLFNYTPPNFSFSMSVLYIYIYSFGLLHHHHHHHLATQLTFIRYLRLVRFTPAVNALRLINNLINNKNITPEIFILNYRVFFYLVIVFLRLIVILCDNMRRIVVDQQLLLLSMWVWIYIFKSFILLKKLNCFALEWNSHFVIIIVHTKWLTLNFLRGSSF